MFSTIIDVIRAKSCDVEDAIENYGFDKMISDYMEKYDITKDELREVTLNTVNDEYSDLATIERIFLNRKAKYLDPRKEEFMNMPISECIDLFVVVYLLCTDLCYGDYCCDIITGSILYMTYATEVSMSEAECVSDMVCACSNIECVEDGVIGRHG